jgi:putative redox protein
MSNYTIDLQWISNMAFKSELNGHEIKLDVEEQHGGKNLGPRPKPLLMAALGGCTGMDVVALLKKMRIEISWFNIRIEAEVTEEHPKQFIKFHLIYEFKGKDLSIEQLKKAVDLSQERYCGISATLKKAVAITYEIKILE